MRGPVSVGLPAAVRCGRVRGHQRRSGATYARVDERLVLG